MTTSIHKYKSYIDGLRAIAVIGVIAFHFFPKTTRGGFVGVDIFFVISGYLISGIIFSDSNNGNFSFLKFYARRARRIFPALALVLFSAVVFGWLFLFPPDLMILGKHVAGGVAFISNFLFWLESGYFDTHSIEKPLLHLWSLGVEEQFYILWPILAYLFITKRRGMYALIIGGIILSFSINIALSTSFIPGFNDVSANFFLPFGRFWQLLTGSSIAYYEFYKSNNTDGFFKRQSKKFSLINISFVDKNTVCLAGALLILCSLFLLNDKLAYPSFWALMPTLGAALIILSGQDAWFNQVILSNRVFVFIGLISYPLYLWHWPLISFTHYLYDDRVPSIVRIFLIVLSVALAWATYRFIETPMRRQTPLSIPVMIATACCFLMGAAGIVIYLKNGFETRYQKHLHQLVNFNATEASKFMLESKCFIGSANNVKMLENCATSPSKPNLPTLMILGDSYAGHLYAGLSVRFSSKWNVRQITSGGCPPILNLKSRFQPTCVELNTEVFKLLKDNPPKRVILSARWHLYKWRDIGSTIDYLRQIGVEQIDLVGPAPEWTQSLNRILYKFAHNLPAITPIPEHLLLGLKPELALLDDQMRDLAFAYKVRYFSPRSAMCNEKGCLTYVNNDSGALTSFDYGHLTKEGSMYIGSHFPE